MKKQIVFVFAILLCGSCFSQLTKGNILAGGSISFESQKYSAGRSNNSTFNFMPGAGYFFIDKLAGGLRASFIHFKGDVNTRTEWVAGPFARYYFLKAARPANVFLEGNFMLGSSKYSSFNSESKIQFGASGGAAFFFNQHVAAEASLGWRSVKYGEDDGHYTILSIGLGFQIHLDGLTRRKIK